MSKENEKRITFIIKEDTFEKMRLFKYLSKKTGKDIVNEALEEYFKNHEKEFEEQEG